MARDLDLNQIPEGWTYGLLDDYGDRCSGHTPSKSRPEYWNGGIKWISLSDSFRLDTGLVSETDKEISQAGIENSSAQVHPAGTVVLSRDAGIGKSGVMAEPMAVSQHFIAWKCDAGGKLHNWFLYNWLQLYKGEFERQAVGSTIKTIGLTYFKKLKIALPEYSEQQKIARILSTWDKAIATTEDLIATSRQQKKALMQQLLTGKKRLLNPETGLPFSGEWEENQLQYLLDKIIDYRGQSVPKAPTGIPLITARNVRKGCLDFSSQEFIDESKFEHWMKRGIPRVGDLLFTTEAPLGMVCLYPTSGLYGVGQRTVTLRVNEKIKSDFLLYFLLSEKGQLFVDLRSSGSTAKGIKSSELKKVKVIYPIDISEQQKIAQVLTSADKEIETLEAKLAHLGQEKKALMQQLLTGKRRVLVEEQIDEVMV